MLYSPARSASEKLRADDGEPREAYEYILAACIHGEHATDYFSPERVGNDLKFINAPATRFIKPDQTSTIFFPIQCGARQERLYLTEVIETQRQRQQEYYQHQSEEKKKRTLEECFPKDPGIGSAKITSSLNKRGHREFMVHLPIAKVVPKNAHPIEAVIGVHEFDDGYFYAVVRFDGGVSWGEIPVRPALLPRNDKSSYSDNYVYDIANTLVRLGQEHHAAIGVEDTRWKRQATLSVVQNRRVFRRPRAKIFATLEYKALLGGLLKPIVVGGVSPRDCHTCWSTDEGTTKTGIVEDKHFACTRCGMAKEARINSAITVARRTALALIENADDIRMARQRRSTQ